MNLSVARSEIEKMFSQRNGYLTLAAGAIVLCFLQSLIIFALIGREKIVIVPPSIEKRFWISAQGASAEYLSEMSAFFVNLRLNMTPDSVFYQHELLLHYVDPAFYNAVKAELVKESDKIKDQHISTVFYPVNIKVDAKKLIAIIEGDFKPFVGEVAMPVKRTTYKISYRFDDGKLLVKSFEEVIHA